MISTRCKCIDSKIGGGITPESLTLIYGEPETGKTTLSMQCAVNCASQNYKTLFVDCDNAFSTKRLSQLSADKFDRIAEQIILIKPKDFREQTALVDYIQDYTEKNFGRFAPAVPTPARSASNPSLCNPCPNPCDPCYSFFYAWFRVSRWITKSVSITSPKIA